MTPWTWLRPPHDPHHEPLPIRPARLCAPGHLPASRTHTLRLPRDLSLAVLNAVWVTWSPQARLVRFLQHEHVTNARSIHHTQKQPPRANASRRNARPASSRKLPRGRERRPRPPPAPAPGLAETEGGAPVCRALAKGLGYRMSLKGSELLDSPRSQRESKQKVVRVTLMLRQLSPQRGSHSGASKANA